MHCHEVYTIDCLVVHCEVASAKWVVPTFAMPRHSKEILIHCCVIEVRKICT